MSVDIAEASILREWGRTDEGEIQVLFRSKGGLEELIVVAERAVDRIHADLSDEVGVTSVAGTPRGPVFFYDHSDTKSVLLASLSVMARTFEEAGLDGRVTVFTSERSPLDTGSRVAGFVAGLSLVGEVPSTPRPAREGPYATRWDVAAETMDVVIQHALDWTNTPTRNYWIQSGLIRFKALQEQREALLRPSLGNSPGAAVMGADGGHLVRRVAFTMTGEVIYSLGGDEAGTWRQQVAELRTVLVDLHESVDYAMVKYQGPDVNNSLDLILWQELSSSHWGSHQAAMEAQFPGYDTEPHERDRSKARTSVANAFGIQLLGPSYSETVTGDRWTIENLGAGRRLVESTDPEAWFAHHPSLELLLNSRRDFRSILRQRDMP